MVKEREETYVNTKPLKIDLLVIKRTASRTEIRVGETKIQTFLDAGDEITWPKMIPGTPPQIQEYDCVGTGFMCEKAGEMFPDFKGDSAMWFSSGLKNYDYFMGFDSNTGEMRSFSVEREYDVDWNSN